MGECRVVQRVLARTEPLVIVPVSVDRLDGRHDGAERRFLFRESQGGDALVSRRAIWLFLVRG